MKISAQAKLETRARIVAAAHELFAEKGFAQTTTRDLAAAAHIAAGTLFNYFPSKEALGMSLLADALERGREGYRARRRGAESLTEDLFAHLAAGLRELEPYRHFIGDVLESAMSAFSRAPVTDDGETVRLRHLETVNAILSEHEVDVGESFVAMHLYWTLALGVLAFYSKDDSPGQADTLVVLDCSMRLFVSSSENGLLSADVRSDSGLAR